jgi:Zn-dependent oligopeptidase
MDYSELLHSHVDTFRHYVANNKTITEERKNKIRKFLNNVLKLARLKIDRDFTELAEIKKSLTKENDMISWGHKYWLLEKLKEIEDTN